MYNTSRLKALLGALIVGGFAALSAPAFAANDAMIDLLKILKDKGSITQEEYDLLVGAAKADDESNTGPQKEIQAAAKTLPKVTTEGRLEIAKPDGEFSWRIGGRAHLDSAFYDNDQGVN
ncbi:MAG: hypothetical protein ACREUU_19700, partial [Gammaproteobacteria bacterium]